MRFAEKLTLEQILTWTALFTTLIVTPWFSYEPINVPKLAVITLGAFMGLGLLAANLKQEWLAVYKSELVIIGLFIVDLTLVLIFSGNNFYQEFFGTFGRATGYVAYICLSLLLVCALVVSGPNLIKKLALSVLAGGVLSATYGVIQSLNFDPINWSNPYSPVLGFLGNPNFQSSFIGFSGVITFSYLIQKTQKPIFRVGLMLYLLVAAYVIYATDSQQGFLILAGGMGIVLLIWVKSTKFRRLVIPLTLASTFGLFIAGLGMLNMGPLASLLYKPSVTYRGDYWRAGWRMTVEHPFVGVGLDSYGDWYRRARTVEATLRRGPEITSNAAHNVLLDLSSNGGFPLLIIYLVLAGLVIRSIFRLLQRSLHFDAPLAGLIAIWFAYHAQSIISLNQLGLAVWGWIISGALIGHEINTRSMDGIQSNSSRKKKQRTVSQIGDSKVQPKTLLTMFTFLIAGVLVGLPPLVASTNYFTALKSQDPKKIQQASKIWPLDPNRIVQVAVSLANRGLQEQALSILEEGKARFPDDFQIWRVISEIPKATPEQKVEAKSQMKRLDPFNPELK